MTSDTSHGAARLRVLAALKRLGPIEAERLAEELELTAMAVRQHLYALEGDGLVSFAEAARPRGRPAKLWRTEPPADAYFTDAHAALTADLITGMKTAFGEKGLERILKLRTAAQVKAYSAALSGKKTLQAKLKALAKLRSEEGYMAEVRGDGAGGYLLVENNCPVCAAARLCTGLCREELACFRAALGKGAQIARRDHIIAGARRCVYHVTALSGSV